MKILINLGPKMKEYINNIYSYKKKEVFITKILEFERIKWLIDKYPPILKKDWLSQSEYIFNIIKQALSQILIYSSYIDFEGVRRLDSEENGDKRRDIYWKEEIENDWASRIQVTIR